MNLTKDMLTTGVLNGVLIIKKINVYRVFLIVLKFCVWQKPMLQHIKFAARISIGNRVLQGRSASHIPNKFLIQACDSQGHAA